MISIERIEKLWEWCGFEVRVEIWVEDHYEPDGRLYNPDGEMYDAPTYYGWPYISLSNLFKWAVPKCQLRGEIVSLIALEHSSFECCIAYFVEPEPRIEVRDEDPAIAVSLAIEKLIEEIG